MTTTGTDDLLKPVYEIERIPLRIGHGFDIHRMAPVEEAGQPLVIGGVIVTHKDQKVRTNPPPPHPPTHFIDD
jgi:2-C-methyl-D-erythritol 2,4-cyclodiphosphate synthase